MINEDAIRYRWETVGSKLDERGRRLALAKGRIRHSGGGRKAVSENDLELIPELKRLVEPATIQKGTTPLAQGRLQIRSNYRSEHI